jgi:hypothetical protein
MYYSLCNVHDLFTDDDGDDDLALKKKFLDMETAKDDYRRRKLEIMEKSLEYQRRSTIALEALALGPQDAIMKDPIFSVSPVIRVFEQ